ncbi:MAG: hypothetical protein ACI9TF_001918 [Paracrocinitomix sp.]
MLDPSIDDPGRFLVYDLDLGLGLGLVLALFRSGPNMSEPKSWSRSMALTAAGPMSLLRRFRSSCYQRVRKVSGRYTAAPEF